ncbi:MAG TPA: M24 family metallopeptidase [Bryobacteraceae bacterium]|jgi:Xaa-Pro aminopeptidase|nr:M24 family metallopeptidase [Bryobacteraceae bacterium]
MRLKEIQAALRDEGLDGWLFFDHHHRDPLAYRVMQFTAGSMVSRRWYYFIPATGEPRGLVHKIEAETLKELPGEMTRYAGWSEMVEGVRALLGGATRVAMQYSPDCAVPYVAMVDAGTIDLIRGLGVEPVTSANLVQTFEAVWTKEQLEVHLEAGRKVDLVRREAFEHIGAKQRAKERVTEWDVKQFILARFHAEGLFIDHGPDVAVNSNASNPHYDPSEPACSEIKRGDKVLIDMWAKLDRPGSVYYDITWMGFCGDQPPGDFQKIFDIVTGARDAAIRRVQQAVAAKQVLHGYEVDDAARAHIRDAGYADYFFHRTGHSIGENVHGTGANMDNLETHDERKVIPGTCFSIEPGIYLKDFGVRSEINMYVDETSARVTGEMQKQIVLI